MEIARALYGLDDSEDKRGPGAFRNLINLRARELVEKQKETGDSVGSC